MEKNAYFFNKALNESELAIDNYIIYAGDNVEINVSIQVATDKYNDVLTSILDLCKNFAM